MLANTTRRSLLQQANASAGVQTLFKRIGRNNRIPKNANNGARPNCSFGRKWREKCDFRATWADKERWTRTRPSEEKVKRVERKQAQNELVLKRLQWLVDNKLDDKYTPFSLVTE
ncbi:MAG: hypothetical protein MHM6MM_000382 [Cercozoa sp. M6MM]